MNDTTDWYNQGYRAGRLDASMVGSLSYPPKVMNTYSYEESWWAGYEQALKDYNKEQEMKRESNDG